MPGLYVGSGAGLGPTQLYDLPFTHYWGAYNLNGDERPAVCGLQMQQSVPNGPDRVNGYNFEFQVDTVMADRLNGLPVMLTTDDWLASLQRGMAEPFRVGERTGRTVAQHYRGVGMAGQVLSRRPERHVRQPGQPLKRSMKARRPPCQ